MVRQAHHDIKNRKVSPVERCNDSLNPSKGRGRHRRLEGVMQLCQVTFSTAPPKFREYGNAGGRAPQEGVPNNSRDGCGVSYVAESRITNHKNERNQKVMKKFIKSVTVLTMFSLVLSTVSMVGATSANVNTSLNQDAGGGIPPIVKAKWEMNGPWSSLLGTDASTAAGAQFTPPGVWNGVKKISFCAIVTDPDGVSDINAVYADIYYPQGRAFHPVAGVDNNNAGGGLVNTTSTTQYFTDPDFDYGQNGCGLQVGDEILLTKLTKEQGISLFCTKIKNNNSNLTTFNTGYNYEEICAPTGELEKETAYVYCGDRDISYEDPDGSYLVKVFAQDKAGVSSTILENHFDYLPLTAFAVDFTGVSYGNVKLLTHKIISGDLTFGTANLPTVRNLGNTRLQMNVWQDDMGLGTTNGQPNVQYDA